MTRVDLALLHRLLLRGPVTAVVAGHVAANWSVYVLVSWLPSYFHEVHGLSIANAGLFSAAPWLSMVAVGNVVASVSDRLIERGGSVTRTRKYMQGIALLGSAAFLLALHEAHRAGVAATWRPLRSLQ